MAPAGPSANLLRGAANEGAGVHQVFQVVVDGGEEVVVPDPLDEVVLTALLLDNHSSLLRQATDLFMYLLKVGRNNNWLHLHLFAMI